MSSTTANQASDVRSGRPSERTVTADRSASAGAASRSASRGRVYRECDYLGPYQLVAATPNVCRYVVQGDSRYVEVRVRRLLRNQQHVMRFMQRVTELTSWSVLPKAVNGQLERENARSVGPNTWVYGGERYAAGVHFAAPIRRLESLSRARSASRSRAATPVPVAAKPTQVRKRNRDKRAAQVAIPPTDAQVASDSVGRLAAAVGSVAAVASGLAETVVGKGAAAHRAGVVASSVLLPLLLVMMIVGVPKRAVFWALLLSSAWSLQRFVYVPKVAPARAGGLVAEVSPIELPTFQGCVVYSDGCYQFDVPFWDIGGQFVSQPCGYLPVVITEACPKGCRYRDESEPYVCEATNEACPIVEKYRNEDATCLKAGKPTNEVPLNRSLASELREENTVLERDDYAGGVGLDVQLCGHRPMKVRIGDMHFDELLCHSIRVMQDGAGTDRTEFCVDSHCQSLQLRRPYSVFSVIPGKQMCDRRKGVRCSPIVWDPVRRAVVRSYNVSVSMTVRLGSIGLLSFEPYTVELACDDAICPVSRDFYGQVMLRSMGEDVGPINLAASDCKGLCYQWRLLLVHLTVYTILTVAFGLVLRYGTWKWALATMVVVVAYSVSVGQSVFWRKVAGWVFAGFLAVFLLGVILMRRRPSWVKLLIVYIVLASAMVGSYAQCIGIDCNSTASTIRCNIARYVRCGRAVRPCPSNMTSLGPYFEFAPAVCVESDVIWDNTAVLYWSFVQRLGYGAVNASHTQKYALVGPIWYRVDNGYLRPLSAGAVVRASWAAISLPLVLAMVINVPVDEFVTIVMRKVATVSYFLALAVVFYLRLPFWRSLLLSLLLTMVYFPAAYAAPITTDAIVLAAPGSCIVVTSDSGVLDVCVVNRTDHMHVSTVMTGVPCRMDVVHRLECDHQEADLPTCETYPADEGRPGRMIDYYDECTSTKFGDMAACTMATLAHSWCYAAQWRGCYSYYSVREQPGSFVEAIAVMRVHTRLSIAVNGSLARLTEGQVAEVAGVTIGLTAVNAAPHVPPLLWRFNSTYYVPTLATMQFAGAFQCIRDASGRFTFDRSKAESHVRAVGLSQMFTPPEMYVRDDNTLRTLEMYAGCGCTGAVNDTLLGCQCGQAFLRITSTGHTYAGREAVVVSANVERTECLTVDRFVLLYVQVIATVGGYVRSDNELCAPQVFVVPVGTTMIVFSCRRTADSLRLSIGSVPIGVAVACRVAESILDTPFKLVPYVPEQSSDGLPALSTDFWAAMLSKYLWAIALVSGAILFLLILPLLIKLIRLVATFIDRANHQIPVKRD